MNFFSRSFHWRKKDPNDLSNREFIFVAIEFVNQ